MSWFTELASKAEAMLVKLDQDTAQALQVNGPQNSTRDIAPDDKTKDINGSAYQKLDQTSQGPLLDSESTADLEKPGTSHENGGPTDSDAATGGTQESQGISHHSSAIDGGLIQELNNREKMDLENVMGNKRGQDVENGHVSNAISHVNDSPYQSRKFRLQTSKLNPTFNNRESKASSLANAHSSSSKRNIPVISLGADDIRASINKSLQEYSQLSSHTRLIDDRPEQTSYSSHFDDQPNLISHSPRNEDQSGRLHSSPSFSIDVPDDQTTDITSQILKQSALYKKSSFNLHKVINRLASHRGHSHSLLGDKTKIRLRRAQMRAASYLRRMNYYFQAYPAMKYWMIGYLVILQILVVYVLFFYQSSGSSNYLTSQVKQQELAELSQHSNSEKILPYASDQTNNRLR